MLRAPKRFWLRCRSTRKHDQRLAAALRRLIAAVKLQADAGLSEPKLATEFLADSYYQQSGAIRGVSLKNALDLAKQAVAVSPDSAWPGNGSRNLSFVLATPKTRWPPWIKVSAWRPKTRKRWS